VVACGDAFCWWDYPWTVLLCYWPSETLFIFRVYWEDASRSATIVVVYLWYHYNACSPTEILISFYCYLLLLCLLQIYIYFIYNFNLHWIFPSFFLQPYSCWHRYLLRRRVVSLFNNNDWRWYWAWFKFFCIIILKWLLEFLLLKIVIH